MSCPGRCRNKCRHAQLRLRGTFSLPEVAEVVVAAEAAEAAVVAVGAAEAGHHPLPERKQ